MRVAFSIIFLSLLISGCTTWSSLNFISPYKIDIQQGNVVKQEDVSKLKQGMTKSEVKILLGTPLLADPFHANRWDYIFWSRKGHSKPEEKKFTIIFDQDKLARVEGDIVAAQPNAEIVQ